MWFVYILKCNNGDYYKGCTSDLDNRLAQHQAGKVKSTSNNLPVELIVYITFLDKYKAYEFEKILEEWFRKSFFKQTLGIDSLFAFVIIAQAAFAISAQATEASDDNLPSLLVRKANASFGR
jgi:predicted GIY-YIG superfamily endonuclease